MRTENEAQSEDQPIEEVVETQNSIKETQTVGKKGLIDRALPWVIVAIVFFLAGALVIYFALYQPKVAELTFAQSELVTAAENAAALQGQVDTAQSELTSVQAELAAAQTTITEQTAALAKSDQFLLIYKFQADVNAARATLSKLDPASTRQALSFVSSDLVELEKTDLDPEALSGFKAKIEEATLYVESDPQKTLDALETLYSNLLLLISNLQ